MTKWTYSRCSKCSCSKRQVFPDGPASNDFVLVMCIGDSPGYQEDKHGIPFYGTAGKELRQTYIQLAGLDNSQVFFTNAVQCRQERDGADIKPTADLTAVCASNHLPEEINTVCPQIIVLLGAAACRLAGITKLEFEHGIPRRVNDCLGLGGWSGVVVPMYHPAAGLRDSKYMIPQLQDWENLGSYIRGTWEPPEPDQRIRRYDWITTPRQVHFAFDQCDVPWDPRFHQYKYLPIDTESDEGRLYSIQFSPRPCYGYMFLTSNQPVMNEFTLRLRSDYSDRVAVHNAMHDLDELESYGCAITDWRDTMDEMFVLGSLPQGLKAACYRTTGHRMTSYEEVVIPHSQNVLSYWLEYAAAYLDTTRTIEPHPIGKKCPTCGKGHRKTMDKELSHPADAVIRRVIKHMVPDSDYDAWQKPKFTHGKETYRLLGQPWLPELESLFGRMPRPSIVHAPLDQQLVYGCMDADECGKLSMWVDAYVNKIMQTTWRVA